MSKRLTFKHKNIYGQETGEWEVKVTLSEAIDKLGQLENILEKYGIDDVYELYVRLDKTLVEWRNEVDEDFKKMIEKDRDIWKKACELAEEEIPDSQQFLSFNGIRKMDDLYDRASKLPTRKK